MSTIKNRQEFGLEPNGTAADIWRVFFKVRSFENIKVNQTKCYILVFRKMLKFRNP